jgi:hypothetical protein
MKLSLKLRKLIGSFCDICEKLMLCIILWGILGYWEFWGLMRKLEIAEEKLDMGDQIVKLTKVK